MKKLKFQFSVTGLILAIIFISMFATVFVNLLGTLETNYNLESNNTLSQYDQYQELNDLTNNIRVNATDIKQNTNALDVIGGFFSSGYTALKLTYISADIVNNMTNQASDDVVGFSLFGDYLILIIMVALFIGVGVAVLVKMRI